MKKPLLSIIIVTWNTAATTKKCIDSIIEHTKNIQLPQIIVVDNNSTDNTPDIISNLPKVDYLRLPKNFGYATACNRGANLSKADHLLFLNSDMEMIDSTVFNMLSYFQKHPTCGLIGPAFLNPDKSRQGSVLPPQTLANAFRQFYLNQPVYLKFSPKGNSPKKVWAISGGAILTSTKIFSRLGGWDERYHMYYEDLELCRQARKKQLDIVYFPRCRFIHRHGVSGSKLADNANQWRRLIKSSLIYHGTIYHHLINLIIYTGQKWQNLK